MGPQYKRVAGMATSLNSQGTVVWERPMLDYVGEALAGRASSFQFAKLKPRGIGISV
jgi:hypothetical protein